MAANSETKIEPKTILLVVGVLVLVGFAIWQVLRNTTGAAANDLSFTSKIEAPPDSTRPPGFEGREGSLSEKQ
jgi:hypothetical protein